MRQISLILIILLSINIVQAAIIHGTVYDLKLNKMDNVIVELNSEPIQRMVSLNGTYRFQVNQGDYIITSKIIENNMILMDSVDEIKITAEGEFVYDLFLFPSISEEEDLLNYSDFDFEEEILEESNKLSLIGYLSLILSIILVIIIFIYLNRLNSIKSNIVVTPENDYLHKLIKLLEDNNGRLTQKEIRKEIPLSEAKISLMISDLVAKQLIKKIKKGRSNIIILNWK